MNTTSQTSKIGQLPRNIRHQLGCRIQAGQSDADLAEWLNAQDAVKETLKEHFGEETLTEENLAEWKDSGHPEWLRQQQTAEKARRLAVTMQLGGKWVRCRFLRKTRSEARAYPPWICKRRTTKSLRKKIEQTRPSQPHGYGLAEHAQDPARHRATVQRFNLSTPGIGRKSTLIKANQA